jgi:RNA polymerase sigma-B factor
VGIPASHPPDPRERAIEEHLSLVRAIARRYAGRGEPIDELVQAGCVGLIKAVDRYDPDRGPALAAYAAPAIEGEIRHHLRTHDRHAGREAGPALDAIEAGSGQEARSEARLLLAGGWATLSERERRLLELRYFGDLTQAQIAQELGLSQAQVSRLLRATLDRLRTELGDDVAGAGDRAYSATEMATPAPEPEEPKAHSGRLLVRMPPSLHTQLAETAEREGVSLNTLVTGALAGAVGWRDGGADEARHQLRNGSSAAAPDDPPGTSERRRTLLSVALAANFAIVAIAAVLAIVLLVVAWQGG